MAIKYLVFNHGEYDDKEGGFGDLVGIYNSFDEAERAVLSLGGGYSKLDANIWRYDCEGEPEPMGVYEHRYTAKLPYWVKLRISEDGQRREFLCFVNGQWQLEGKNA